MNSKITENIVGEGCEENNSINHKKVLKNVTDNEVVGLHMHELTFADDYCYSFKYAP